MEPGCCCVGGAPYAPGPGAATDVREGLWPAMGGAPYWLGMGGCVRMRTRERVWCEQESEGGASVRTPRIWMLPNSTQWYDVYTIGRVLASDFVQRRPPEYALNQPRSGQADAGRLYTWEAV